MIYEFGFRTFLVVQGGAETLYLITLGTGILSLIFQYSLETNRPKVTAWWLDALYAGILLIIGLQRTTTVFILQPLPDYFLELAVFWVFLREFSNWRLPYSSPYLNPARLFVGSFMLLVLMGTLLLMLPRATHDHINLLDALFTSTSAVCVTGLIVVDTATHFTKFGQTIILILIQIGGIGIMTFTSYFSYFFRGESSFQQQMALRDLTNSDRIAEVFDSLRKIIVLTLMVEMAGALLVYSSIDHSLFQHPADAVFFSIFHAISGFCNAGFSTLSNGLYETGIRFNYPLQLILVSLFIIGGIGFPIVFNFWRYFRHLVVDRLIPAGSKKPLNHKPWIINLNTRIVLITTGILLVAGTFFFTVLEWNNALAGHSQAGKLVVAFFQAATPRTAGFNSVDLTILHFPTLMLIILLMWVGASPASTGGGIKTSTLALATFNFLNIARGKNRVELYGREISERSLNRAFALISLSLLTIGTSIFLLSITEKDMDLLKLAFEAISAYSTVGLSLNTTSYLSNAGKMVIIATMFVGRVSLLSILISLLRQEKSRNYRYPSDEILIN